MAKNHRMLSECLPLKLLLCVFSGWIHRQQGQVIDYLVEENCVRREQLKGKRLRLTATQRRRVAAKAKRLGTPGVMNEIRQHGIQPAPRGRPRGTPSSSRTRMSSSAPTSSRLRSGPLVGW
jgi:hypothetical protein